MYCIGLTGNIATGKTAALQCFADFGITIISADAIAKNITQSDTVVLHAIREYFGPGVFMPSGELDRRALRKIVFNDQEKRLWLEKLLHPRIKAQIQVEIAQAKPPYCVIEIPLLFKRKDFSYINRVLLLTTDKATQLSRIINRDHCTEKEANDIINTQPSEESRKKIADDVLNNNESNELLRDSIYKLHNQYVSMSFS